MYWRVEEDPLETKRKRDNVEQNIDKFRQTKSGWGGSCRPHPANPILERTASGKSGVWKVPRSNGISRSAASAHVRQPWKVNAVDKV